MTSKDHTENKAMLSNHRKQLPFKWRITCRWLPLEYFTHPFSRFEPVKATQTVKASGGSMPKIYKNKSIIQQKLSGAHYSSGSGHYRHACRKTDRHTMVVLCYIIRASNGIHIYILCVFFFKKICTFVCITMSKWRQRLHFRTP